MTVYRYSRWDGTQEVFPLHDDELMGELSRHLMSQGDVSAGLRSLLQRRVRGRNGQRLAGVQDLLQRLRSLRQSTLDQYDLGSLLEDLKRRLEDVVRQEMAGIDRRVEEVRRRAQEQPLDQGDLPQSTGQELIRVVERMAGVCYR